jgi:hypothetical protein
MAKHQLPELLLLSPPRAVGSTLGKKKEQRRGVGEASRSVAFRFVSWGQTFVLREKLSELPGPGYVTNPLEENLLKSVGLCAESRTNQLCLTFPCWIKASEPS